MREIRFIRAKLQTRKNSILKAGRESAGTSLRSFLLFLSDSPVLSMIVQSLPAYEYNEPALIEKLQRDSLGLPDDDRLRASMCLAVLKANSEDEKLEKFALNFLGAGGKWDEMIHSFLDEQLAERETWISPADIAYDVQSLVDNTVAEIWPAVVERLQSAYQLLFSATTGNEFAAIGNVCRDALIEVGKEVFREEYVPEGAEQPKRDDARSLVRHALRRGLPGPGKTYRDAVDAMFRATWDYVVVLVHRGSSATMDDARQAVIYTYLAVEGLYKLFATRAA
jgi:hypothetical protein